jgi:hypothetical protein
MVVVKSILEIQDRLHKMMINLIIHISWNEPRIVLHTNYSKVAKSRDFTKCIWTPNLWFTGQQSIKYLDLLQNELSLMINNSSTTLSDGVHNYKPVETPVNCT